LKAGETKDLGDVHLVDEAEFTKAVKAALGQKEAKPAAAKQAVPAKQAAAADDEQATQEYAGTVVDPSGRPAQGAEVYFFYYKPGEADGAKRTFEPVAKTDASGAFRFRVSPKDYHATAQELGNATLAATLDGYGFAWSHLTGKFETTGRWLAGARARLESLPQADREQDAQQLAGAGEPLKLALDDEPIRGRVVDINGKPVIGARLTVESIASGVRDDLGPWREAAKQPKATYYSVRVKTPMSMGGPKAQAIVKSVVTDADGRFALRGVGRGRIVELLIEGPGIESVKIHARSEAGEKIELDHEGRSFDLGKDVYQPAEFVHVAGPSAPIVGTVRDAKTKAPLAGAW
jgi:hypothetical protein